MASQLFQTVLGYFKPVDEQARAAALLDAQAKAAAIFKDIEANILRPGISEKEMSKEIQQLVFEKYEIKQTWHKNIVRAGPNTLRPYKDNLTDRVIEEDEILFIDLGPVFENVEKWEADFGCTFVLGNDPYKKKLRVALEPIWHQVKARYLERPSMTGSELYSIVVEVVEKAGWQPGREHAGHILGNYPHERIPKDMITFFIHPENNLSMARKDKNGCKLHWILEIHMTDGNIGGFFEQLLTIE